MGLSFSPWEEGKKRKKRNLGRDFAGLNVIWNYLNLTGRDDPGKSMGALERDQKGWKQLRFS